MAEKSSTMSDVEKPALQNEATPYIPPSMSKELDTDSTPRQSEETALGKNMEITQSKEEEEREYLEGLKLVLVLAAVTMVCFLVLLDTSIVVTVCRSLPLCGMHL